MSNRTVATSPSRTPAAAPRRRAVSRPRSWSAAFADWRTRRATRSRRLSGQHPHTHGRRCRHDRIAYGFRAPQIAAFAVRPALR